LAAGALIAREKHLLRNQLVPSSESICPLCSLSKEKKTKKKRTGRGEEKKNMLMGLA